MGRIEGLLLDIDGVLVTSWRALPHAVEAVQGLRARGIPFRLLTNTTELSRSSVVRLLHEAGFEVGPDEILTAVLATREYLLANHAGARCFVLASPESFGDLDGVRTVEEGPAEVVVVGGPGPWFTYERLNRAFRLLMEGAALVAMQRNAYWRTDEGLMLDAGAFVTGLEAVTGAEAVTIGKPARAMFEAGLRLLGLPADRVAMVGDDLDNDVLAAQAVGLTGVLVRTGKFRPEVLDGSQARPDLVLDSVAEVEPALLEGSAMRDA